MLQGPIPIVLYYLIKKFNLNRYTLHWKGLQETSRMNLPMR